MLRLLEESRTRTRAAKKFTCVPCQLDCASPSEFANHNKTKTHLDTVSGERKSLKNKNEAAWMARNIELKKYYCGPCDKAFGKQQVLDKHLVTLTHANNVVKAKANSTQLA
jgi:hypothetical protein